MKNKFLIGITALASAISLHAATSIGVLGTPGAAGYAVYSASGQTNNTTLATNGLYTAGIASNTTETNLVLLTPGAMPDGDVVIQFTAAATGSTTTNVVFVLTSSVLPISITNNSAIGNNSANPRGTFNTYTLALNGTTTVTTNVVLSKATTPTVANGLSLYLESIQMGVASGVLLTNYSVAVVQ